MDKGRRKAKGREIKRENGREKKKEKEEKVIAVCRVTVPI